MIQFNRSAVMASLKTLSKIHPNKLQGKRVLVRVDFNVAMKKGKVSEDFRIKAAVPTISYLRKQKAKIILMSHLGEPAPFKSLSGEWINDPKAKEFSLAPVAKYLEKVLKKKVKFVSDCVGEKVQSEIAQMKNGEILVLENVRFYKEEEQNNDAFAKQLAQNADYFINDAFAVAHRNHASVVAITKYLPSCAGFLLANEVDVLTKAYTHPKKPLCIVMGGSKITTKINLILRFFNKADHILIGGALANTLLSAKGYAIGKSKSEKDMIDGLRGLDLTSTKIHLPIDTVVAKEISEKAATKIKGAGNIEDDELILDLGPDTIKLFNDIINKSKMVIWNGPLGLFELKKFSKGTNEFAKNLVKTNAFTVLGGGDTISAADKLNILNRFDFVSTGGGAMLELLAGDELPGVEALKA